MSAIPKHGSCELCGKRTDRVFATPAFSTRGDDLNGGKPVYCPGLASYQRKGRQDPKAWFASKSKARDAARRKADSADGYSLHLD
jgi:hypothetical protein